MNNVNGLQETHETVVCRTTIKFDASFSTPEPRNLAIRRALALVFIQLKTGRIRYHRVRNVVTVQEICLRSQAEEPLIFRLAN